MVLSAGITAVYSKVYALNDPRLLLGKGNRSTVQACAGVVRDRDGTSDEIQDQNDRAPPLGYPRSHPPPPPLQCQHSDFRACGDSINGQAAADPGAPE